jgi:hypothetical protein
MDQQAMVLLSSFATIPNIEPRAQPKKRSSPFVKR